MIKKPLKLFGNHFESISIIKAKVIITFGGSSLILKFNLLPKKGFAAAIIVIAISFCGCASGMFRPSYLIPSDASGFVIHKFPEDVDRKFWIIKGNQMHLLKRSNSITLLGCDNKYCYVRTWDKASSGIEFAAVKNVPTLGDIDALIKREQKHPNAK